MGLNSQRTQGIINWLAGIVGAIVVVGWALPREADYRQMSETISLLPTAALVNLLGGRPGCSAPGQTD